LDTLLSLALKLNSWGAALEALGKTAAVLLLLVGILGWKLNQTRLLLSSLYFLAAYYMLGFPQQSAILGLSGASLAESISVAWPLGLLLAFALSEAPLFSQRSLLRVGACLLPLLLLAGLFGQAPEDYHSLMAWKYSAWLALAVFVALKQEAKIKPFLYALGVSTALLLLAAEASLALGPKDPITLRRVILLCFFCISLAQAYAIFSMYWQRVYLDELTAIPNRRALDERLHNLSAPYSLAMVDIDHFKKFNDRYGHEEGDNVLRLVAAHLSRESNQRAYRYGGEEFCLVFDGWETRKAEAACDDLRKALAGREFSIRLPAKSREKTSAKDRGTPAPGAEHVSVTISIGVAGPDKNVKAARDVMKLADQGLYDAKANGRNMVVRQN
jgi:diguanylate cyclase (GGDEF)-like protein